MHDQTTAAGACVARVICLLRGAPCAAFVKLFPQLCHPAGPHTNHRDFHVTPLQYRCHDSFDVTLKNSPAYGKSVLVFQIEIRPNVCTPMFYITSALPFVPTLTLADAKDAKITLPSADAGFFV
mmetsp:Transcript_1734/g.5281  ORF Transcript_1734/g.5281 Transcript_1734/m.5281 type:complete len:124 (-) Transcript_1734:570-941(-)